MRRAALLLLLAASLMVGQAPSSADLLRLTDQLDAAIKADDWLAAAKLSASLKSAVESTRDQSLASAGSDLADTILTWLPPDTETLLVAQQPFTIEAQDETKIPSTLSASRFYSLMLLDGAEKQEFFKALTGRTLKLAAVAARRFGETADGEPGGGLGMIPYQGCGVYAFAEPLAESMLGRPPEDTILGHRVWTSRGSENDKPDSETFFTSLLKPDLALVCNSRDFFQELVARIGLPQQIRALPATLPEWKQVDRSARVWGISHYRNQLVMAMLVSGGDGVEATGITVEFGTATGGARARMLAKSDPWKMLAEVPEFHGAATSHEVSPGVWELVVEGKPDVAMFAAFALMGTLGFVIAL